jgi:methionyl-tRNA synthetase
MRHLITSALPYINGVKHLGNLIGSMLPADVYARFQRARGAEVLFLCATDEHGTPAELAAREAGQTPAEYCARLHLVQKDLVEKFAISVDWFGRSHSRQNHEVTQHLYHALDRNGMLEEVTTRQIYSNADARFLPDRYIVGTCPHCGYDRARGDQCENCGRVLDPTDLIGARSAISGSSDVEVRESKHLFLRQSLMVDRLRSWIGSKRDWPLLATTIALKWLDEGLQDRSITRDLDWGIPVAHDGVVRPGFEGKVFYVWFDAPIEYIGAAGEWAEATGQDWERWWRTDRGGDGVTYTQFLGKDNVPFHTVGFPVTLFGSDEPWKVVDFIKAFNWLSYYGGKFSTSQKRGIFMDQALELLPADCWRWYLLANAPEAHDANFTWEHFQTTVNSDLNDVLGNLVNRLTAFCRSRFGGEVPRDGLYGELEARVTVELGPKLASLTAQLEAREFRKAAAELRSIWVSGNGFLQSSEPWSVIKRDPAAAAASVRYALNLLRLIAAVTQPFLPTTAARIAMALGLEAPLPWPASDAIDLDALPRGGAIQNPGLLFSKIEKDSIDAWRERFGAEPAAG